MSLIQRGVISISASTIWRVVLILLLVWFLFLIRDVIFLLFFAFVIVSAALPIVNRLEEKKIPRVLSAILLYVLFFVCFGFAIYLIAPILTNEFKQFGENLPTYLQGIDLFLKSIAEAAANYELGEGLERLVKNSSNRIADSFSGIFSNTLGFLGGLFKMIVVISLSFYMLVKKNGTRVFLETIVPKKHQEYVVDLVSRIQYKMGRWLIGQFTLVLIVFTFNYLVLTLLDVPFALIIALIGGLLEIIPYIGPTIAIIPAVLIALTISPITALLVLGAYILIQQLENHVFTPLVMRKAVGLNPVVVILALLIGGKLAGLIGVLIAVPFASAVSVFMSDLVKSKEEGRN